MEKEILLSISNQELLAKAEQLEKPSSLVTKAEIGLHFLLLGKPRQRVAGMIAAGKRFLNIVEIDLDCQERMSAREHQGYCSLINNKPRYYLPSEVILLPATEVRSRIVHVRKLLEKFERESLQPLEVESALNDLEELGNAYVRRAGQAISEYKFGTLLSRDIG